MPTDSPAPSKRSWLKAELEALIAAGKVGDRIPSYRKIMRQYNVGQSTIDFVLQDLLAAKKLERRTARGLCISARAKSRNIGLVFEWDAHYAGDSAFDRQLVERCREQALAQGDGFSFYLHVPREAGAPSLDQPHLWEDLETGKLDGVLVVGNGSGRLLKKLDATRIPHVVFSPFSLVLPRVEIDYANLIEQGVGALAFAGSRRIGLISPFGARRTSDPEFRADLDAFAEALSRHRLERIPEAVVEQRPASAAPDETGLETGYWAAAQLLGGPKPNRLGLDGVVVMDELHAQGFLFGAEKLGLRIPADIRVAAHAAREGSPLRFQSEKLFLLEADVTRIVEALFQGLDEWMRQGRRPARLRTVPVSLRLPAPREFSDL